MPSGAVNTRHGGSKSSNSSARNLGGLYLLCLSSGLEDEDDPVPAVLTFFPDNQHDRGSYYPPEAPLLHGVRHGDDVGNTTHPSDHGRSTEEAQSVELHRVPSDKSPPTPSTSYSSSKQTPQTPGSSGDGSSRAAHAQPHAEHQVDERTRKGVLAKTPLVHHRLIYFPWSTSFSRHCPTALLTVGFCSLLCTSYVNFKTSGAFRQVVDNTKTLELRKFTKQWGSFFLLGSVSSFLRTFCLSEAKLLFERKLRVRVFSEVLRNGPRLLDLKVVNEACTEDVTAAGAGATAASTHKIPPDEVVDLSARDREENAHEDERDEEPLQVAANKGAPVGPRRGSEQRGGSSSSQRTAGISSSSSIMAQLSLLHEDVDTIADFFTAKAANAVRYTSSLVGGTCVAFYNCFTLAAWGFPLFFGIGYAVAKRNSAKTTTSGSESKSCSKTGGPSGPPLPDPKQHAHDRFQAQAVIRSFGKTTQQTLQYANLLYSLTRVESAKQVKKAKLFAVIDLLSKSTLISLALFGSKLVEKEKISSGQLAQFLVASSMAALGFYGLLQFFDTEFAEAVVAGNRLALVVLGTSEKYSDEAASTESELSSSGAVKEPQATSKNSVRPPKTQRVETMNLPPHIRIVQPPTADEDQAVLSNDQKLVLKVENLNVRLLRGGSAIGPTPGPVDSSSPNPSAGTPNDVAEGSRSQQKSQHLGGSSSSYLFPPAQGLSFELKEGDILGLCGRSGSGKTSVLNLLLGELSADAGTVTFFNPCGPNIRYVPQHTTLFGETVLESITFSPSRDSSAGTSASPALVAALDQSCATSFVDVDVNTASSAKDKEADDVENNVEHSPNNNKPTSTTTTRRVVSTSRTLLSDLKGLSGGEQQRLAVARAIYDVDGEGEQFANESAPRPQDEKKNQIKTLYLFDEITSHLDSATETRLAEQLFGGDKKHDKSAASLGTTTTAAATILISHSPNVLRFCTKFLVLGIGSGPQLLQDFAEVQRLIDLR
ncbi:unnamed protein product [Amoebophrya sp. A120]|nr:unnamed protein product [Amoebophrya sp. A120]|eukprot:GSA120T00021043001.1